MEEHESERELRRETHNDYTIYTLEREDTGICFVGKHLVAIGGKPLMKRWLDNHAAGKTCIIFIFAGADVQSKISQRDLDDHADW